MKQGIIYAVLCIILLGCNHTVSNDTIFAIVLPDGEHDQSNWKEIDGIVFYDYLLWSPEEVRKFVPNWAKHESVNAQRAESFQNFKLNNLNILAENLYINGCINSIDMSNPAWGGGDGYQNFFLGDTTGLLNIKYESGTIDQIPLVFGYTAWWHDSYQHNNEPFRSDEAAKTILNNALCVVNGIDGYQNEAGNYYLKIALRNEVVTDIEVVDNTQKTGYYRVNSLSFGSPQNAEELDNSRFALREAENSISDEKLDSINNLVIFSDNSFPVKNREAIKALRHKLYTFEKDVSDSVIQATAPDVKPENFTGPKVTFEGSPIATLLTRIYYENSMVVVNSIDEEGMSHESVKDADNYGAFGTWNPDLGPFYDDAYTRLRSPMVVSNYGMEEKVNKCIDFFDKWMMYFPNAYPEVQLGGKPVPGHATVVANKPHYYFDELRNYGWPTKYTSRDFGNPENDGHGLQMINRYRAWTKQGKDPEWVMKRWEAINEAAEYIPWALNNPDLSFSKHGLLYNESEGGMMKQSMYCDFLCYMGLLGFSEMAEVVGETQKAKRWNDVAENMYEAMNGYYPLQDSKWGDVWDPGKSGMFRYINSTMAPACMGMDFFGYDVMNILSKDWAERTKRTYAMQLSQCNPEFAAPAGMGYGQSYIAQTGLLLDEMKDAKKSVEWMAKLCFTPRLDHPYRVPEGATISSDRKTWRRWGDLGNLYQTCDVVHTIHLILGIDDIQPRQLKLMPRITEDIKYLKIDKWPTRITSGNQSVLTNIDVEMDINRQTKTIKYNLNSDDPVDNGKVRLGPLPVNAHGIQVLENEKPVHFTQIYSGDSVWAWVEFGNKKSFQFEVNYY